MSEFTTIKIRSEVHRQLKVFAVVNELGLIDFASDAIVEKMEKQNNKNGNKKEKPKNGPKAGRGKAKG